MTSLDICGSGVSVKQTVLNLLRNDGPNLATLCLQRQWAFLASSFFVRRIRSRFVLAVFPR